MFQATVMFFFSKFSVFRGREASLFEGAAELEASRLHWANIDQKHYHETKLLEAHPGFERLNESINSPTSDDEFEDVLT